MMWNGRKTFFFRTTFNATAIGVAAEWTAGGEPQGLTSAKSNVEKEECLRKKEKTQKDHFNYENLQKIIKIAS